MPADTDSGGYLYFPRAEMGSSETLMARLLSAMRAPDQLRDWRTFTDAAPTLDDALRQLRLGKRADFIEVSMAGYRGKLYSQDDALEGEYAAIQLAFPFRGFIDRDPRAKELFVTSWLEFCDMARPEYAYFAGAPFRLETKYRDQAIRLLAGRKIPELIAAQGAWLSYLGPRLAPSWRGRLPQATVNEDYTWLPSGALFIRDHDPLAESYLEDTPQTHGSFLERQLEPYRDVLGVAMLLQIVRGDVQGFKDYKKELLRLAMTRAPLEGWPPKAPLSIPQQPDYDADLNEIHTLWATASRRSDLVGVNQMFSFRSADGQEVQTIVPIVAKDGAEWIVPVDRTPFGTEDEVWTIPGIGLRAYTRDLVAAAQQHPVAGQPPHVVVVFWKGVSDAVQGALTAMGAAVEVPTQSVPLIEP